MSVELTQSQRNEFHEQGCLVLPAVFDEGEIRQMREEADRILELIVNSSVANNRRSGRLDICLGANGGQVVRKIQPINDLSLYLSQISNDDRLLAPMRQIMGDEPILIEEKLNYKEPLPEPLPFQVRAMDDRFPIHNDWAYYKAQSYPQSVLSSAISMDDSTETSGPLRVWRGSHKTHLEHEGIRDLGLQVLPGSVDFDGGEDVLAPAGSVMFFHVLLVHNSRGNVSGRPRRLMIYSHEPKAANRGHDERNGPGRLREAPYEWEYVKKKSRGEFQDVFHAPNL